MRTNITKSRSGHYSVVVRSDRYRDLAKRAEKLGDIETARQTAANLKAEILAAELRRAV
ncbi:hypothetical protein [Burkholderia gladioli]|uniref:hypothetical protein n=1 Tax=Burkholderia gladioli TaxID=28095 RepID=UPI00163E6B65|nr:hypothetical protein [Burkholderia gladioli]